MKHRLIACLAAAVLVFPVSSGCGGPGETGGGLAQAPTGTTAATVNSQATVTVKNFGFEPPTLTVAAGTTVTWRFEDRAAHNATATGASKAFASPDLKDGKTFTHTFTSPGRYPYLCTLHQYMTGEIIVT